MLAKERAVELGRREAELARRSRLLAGAPAGVVTEAEAAAAEALPGAEAFAESLARRTAGAIPGGGAVTGIVDLMKAVPRAQWQVTARVRGMVAAEKRGVELAAKLEAGAKRLLEVGKVGGKVAIIEGRRAERGETLKERAKRREAIVDRMRKVAQLANDAEAFANHVGSQGAIVAGELPEFAASISATTKAALDVLAEALPSMPDAQLDRWEPSAAEIAKFNRWNAAINDPTSLLARAREGTITADEVRAVERTYPRVIAQLRATVQTQVNAAQTKGVTLSRQRVQALETLLGYSLTTESSSGAMQRAQQVFGGARRGETEKSDTVRPLPGAARVTLGNRYMTPQQAAAER